jgi:hypothetical protein
MRGERRRASRVSFRDGHLPPAARVRPGSEVIVVDLSSTGALLEGLSRLRPGGRCELTLALTSGDITVRARVARCFVARLERAAAVRYRTAVAFESLIDLSPRWQHVMGYQALVPGATAAPSGVVDTHASRTGGHDCSNSLDFPRDSTRR